MFVTKTFAQYVRPFVLRSTPTHTAWDTQALLVMVNGSPGKKRVKTAPVCYHDVQKCTQLRNEFCTARGIPLQLFTINCRNAGVIQARREVWSYLRRTCKIEFLTIEYVTNFSHANIIDSLATFVPTHELLQMPVEVAA